MGILKNALNSLARNATQQTHGFTGDSYSSQLNNYNGYMTDVYTRHYMDRYVEGINPSGQYDNYYADYNRIITTAPSFPLYYTDKEGAVDEEGNVAQHLATPNDSYPQYKVLQQIYSEMITHGYSDVFLWRKEGKDETQVFEDGRQYAEEDFRGITLVSGYDPNTLTPAQRASAIRIQYGVSQQNVFMGYSPTQAARAWRKMQDEMGLHTTAFARNAGMPIGQWIITANSPEDFVKIRDKLQSETSGAKNSGKQLYSYRPADVKEPQMHWVQFTSQDVQDYTPQLDFSEKKMSQNFGVPGSIKGTNDGETYASARVSEQVFIKYTIKPLVDDLREQLVHAITQRFELSGEIKTNVVIPEVADESKVRIEATQQQVELYDKKIAEGYTPESIVKAYNLPESFLLLEKDSTKKSDEVKSAAGEVAKQALNRAQTSSLLEILDKIMTGSLPTEGAKETILAAFPFLSEEIVDKNINPLQDFNKKDDEGGNDDQSKEPENAPKPPHTHVKNELMRYYQNTLTKKEMDDLESFFRKVVVDYAELVLIDGVVENNREEFVGQMKATFSAQYEKLYGKAVEDVAEQLLDVLDVVDLADLELTAEDIEEAAKQYEKRVEDFSKTFSQDIADLPGETLEVRKAAAEPNIDRVVVTESEHARIVSELNCWTKAQEEFPVRVTKKWNTMPDACDECLELENTEIDVTALFINNPNVSEIYEVIGGGLHPNCRCFCTYVMEGEDVRKFEGGE